MKAFIIATIVMVFASVSLSTIAEARSGMQWRHGGYHPAWRQNGYRHDGWRHRRYWGPGIVVEPGDGGYYGGYDRDEVDRTPVCYEKNVQRFDKIGQAYVGRARVCE